MIQIYEIDYSDDAKEDLDNLLNVITFDYDSPITAGRYLSGLKLAIHSLSTNPERYPIRHNYFMQQYGANARRVNYKKMAIIYTIHENTVRIHRVTASSLILE
jgi:plasmid stabilization system protein ParE